MKIKHNSNLPNKYMFRPNMFYINIFTKSFIFVIKVKNLITSINKIDEKKD